MAKSKKKAGRGKGKGRRVLFGVIPLLLILCLAFYLNSRETPPEKVPDIPIIAPPAPTPSPPRLALIIDDGGYNTEKFRSMLGMGKPLTFAILPNAPHAREASLMAHRGGAEVMLHLPMEPKEEEMYSLEKDTVRTEMKAQEIQRILQDNLKQIPHVRGVNNHMGSKATEDPKVMQALMEALKKEELYFIDSRTSSRTLGLEMAQRVGVAAAQNDRFIDPEKNIDAIKKAIRLVMQRAKKEGKAVAIGHPHPLTARAIREMIPEMEAEGIRLVFASEVVG